MTSSCYRGANWPAVTTYAQHHSAPRPSAGLGPLAGVQRGRLLRCGSLWLFGCWWRWGCFCWALRAGRHTYCATSRVSEFYGGVQRPLLTHRVGCGQVEAGRGCLYAGEALRDGRGSAPPDAFVHVEFIFNYCITGTVAPDSSGHASTVIDGGKKGKDEWTMHNSRSGVWVLPLTLAIGLCGCPLCRLPVVTCACTQRACIVASRITLMTAM